MMKNFDRIHLLTLNNFTLFDLSNFYDKKNVKDL